MREVERLHISVRIFDLPVQHAQVLPHLLPRELIREILEAFGSELAFLGDDAGLYQLVLDDDDRSLDEERALAQLDPGARLALVERPLPLPEGARAVTHTAYLLGRAQRQRVFRITWQPAIIGRTDPHLAGNALVAVDLCEDVTGLRVSRRHAEITEDDGRFFIASLSENPTQIVSSTGDARYVTARPQLLECRDTVVLVNSGIRLEFIVRDTAG